MHRAPGAVVEREEGKQVERMEKRIKREERGGGRAENKEDGWKKEGQKRETVEETGEEGDLMVRERKDL